MHRRRFQEPIRSLDVMRRLVQLSNLICRETPENWGFVRSLPGVLFRAAAPEVSRTSLHEVHELAAGEGLRQGFAVVLQCFNRLFNEFAEFGEHLLGVLAMAAAVKQLWTTADEATVFIGPLDDFYVSVAFPHCFTSLMASETAFSRYRFASSPSFPAIVTALATRGCLKLR